MLNATLLMPHHFCCGACGPPEAPVASRQQGGPQCSRAPERPHNRACACLHHATHVCNCHWRTQCVHSSTARQQVHRRLQMRRGCLTPMNKQHVLIDIILQKHLSPWQVAPLHTGGAVSASEPAQHELNGHEHTVNTARHVYRHDTDVSAVDDIAGPDEQQRAGWLCGAENESLCKAGHCFLLSDVLVVA